MFYYDHHIGDFRSATIHMNRIERAIYRELLDIYYDTEMPLPLDKSKVYRMVSARESIEMEIVDQILDDFFILDEDGYHNKRADHEIDIYRKKAESARENGKKGGRKPKNNQKITQLVLLANPEESGSKANQVTNKPINQDIKDNVFCDAKDTCNCPHQEIINLYHEILPTCPRVKVWTDARKKALVARWREDKKRQSIDYWKRLFEYVSQSDFLMGRTTNPFHGLNIEWIVNSANFTKIIERNYENRG